MKKCLTIEDGVASALALYQFTPQVSWKLIPAGEGEYTDTLVLDGEPLPLLWWRADPQVVTMYGKAPAQKLCSMKLNRTGPKSRGLDALLYKELDIAEHILRSSVKSLMCMRNGSSMNMLCTMESGTVALFELGATLHDGTEEQGRHSCWGQDGMSSDRVVSQKVPSQALYLFTQDRAEPETFNDLFIHMYGLSRTDTLKAVCIAEILLGRRDISHWKQKDAHYRRCIAAAAESARQVRRLDLKEV